MRGEWISSAGGALILMPKDALDDWHGCDEDEDEDEDETDYALTWDLPGLLGTIDWGARQILVVNEPTATIVRPRGEVLVIVQWFTAENEAQFWAQVDAAPLDTPSESIEWTTEPGEHVLFDAAASTALVDFESRSVQLATSRYRVDSHDVHPSPPVRAFVHVFKPID